MKQLMMHVSIYRTFILSIPKRKIRKYLLFLKSIKFKCLLQFSPLGIYSLQTTFYFYLCSRVYTVLFTINEPYFICIIIY